MLLQERIEELDSAILNIKDKVYITGFMSAERLKDYYNKNMQCYLSKGIYEIEDLDFSKVNDNGLFIVLKNNIEIGKYQFVPIKKGSVTYKVPNKKSPLTKVYKIRKCNFSNKYNYVDSETSLLFDNYDDLSNYFMNRFNCILD